MGRLHKELEASRREVAELQKAWAEKEAELRQSLARRTEELAAAHTVEAALREQLAQLSASLIAAAQPEERLQRELEASRLELEGLWKASFSKDVVLTHSLAIQTEELAAAQTVQTTVQDQQVQLSAQHKAAETQTEEELAGAQTAETILRNQLAQLLVEQKTTATETEVFQSPLRPAVRRHKALRAKLRKAWVDNGQKEDRDQHAQPSAQPKATETQPSAPTGIPFQEAADASQGGGRGWEELERQAESAMAVLPPPVITSHYTSPLSLLTDKPRLENVVRQAPARTSTTLSGLCDYLYSACSSLSPTEKAWIVFRWMSLNIAYNADGFFSGNYGDLSLDGVFKSGKGVCSGYARLFQSIGQHLGLNVECVNGYAKGYSYDSTASFKKTNHEWNAVKLNEQWYLIDSTWGAGHLDGTEFVESFNEYFFCPDPKNLIRSHYPLLPRWQLLDSLITKKEFERLLKLDPLFYEFGLTSCDPDCASVSVSTRISCFKVHAARTTAKVNMIATLCSHKGDGTFENATFVQQMGRCFCIDVVYPSPGRYKLMVFAGPQERHCYPLVFSINIICSMKKPRAALHFPQQFPAYADVGAVLQTPRIGPLKSGKVVPFKISSPLSDEVAVETGGRWIHLEKKADGTFEGDVAAGSEDASVYHRVGGKGSYSGLLEYKVEE